MFVQPIEMSLVLELLATDRLIDVDVRGWASVERRLIAVENRWADELERLKVQGKLTPHEVLRDAGLLGICDTLEELTIRTGVVDDTRPLVGRTVRFGLLTAHNVRQEGVLQADEGLQRLSVRVGRNVNLCSVLQNLPMTLMFGIFETFYTENTSRIMSAIPTAVSGFSGFEHFSTHRGRVIFFCQTFENRFWRGIIALGTGFCVMNFLSIAR